MDTKILIESLCMLVMAIGLIGIFAIRWRLKKGIGRRAIQSMTVVLVAPATIILGMEDVLNSQAVAAILGGIAGFTLSGVGGKDSDR